MVKIIFEDNDLLVLDKPPGLVVTPTETHKTKTLVDFLVEYGIKIERGGLVHRLDKDTSGLILVAKTTHSFEALQSQFKSRTVKKEYLALVHGSIMEKGRMEGAVGRNHGDREKFTVLLTGKQAITEYQPILNFKFKILNWETIFNDLNKIQMRKLEKMNYNQFTLLRCKPLTGRTHQIRVHLKYIGHPVVSDEKYVGRKMYRLDHRWCPRQFLHAAKLGFRHPVSGEWIELESPLPEDLKRSLEILNSKHEIRNKFE